MAVVLGSVHGMAKEKKTAKGDRLGKDVTSVVVTRYEKLSDTRDHPEKKKVAVIRKAETVGRLVTLINSLPPAGSAMIKMGDVDYIEAQFYGHYDKPPVVVKLYHGWVKAPDTSFYEGLPAEKEIHEILSQAKPQPEGGLRVKKAKSVRVEEYDHGFYANRDEGPNRSVEITDAKKVSALVDLLNQCPLKGGMFVSFTPYVSMTHVFFVADNGDETQVTFYGNGLATTDGSFYTEEPGEGLQKRFRDIYMAELARTAPEQRYAFDAAGALSASLELKKKLTDERADAREQVTDAAVLKKIQAALSKLPVRGEKMKSWSDDTELLTVTFSRPGAPKTYIEFYDGHLKAPDTAFYAGGNPEKALYQLLKTQLQKGK